MLDSGGNARRWPRSRARLTALVAWGGEEHLAKTLDVGDGGIGLALEGDGPAVFASVRVCLLVGDAVLEQQGLVVHREPLGAGQRLGVRLGAVASVPFAQCRPVPEGVGGTAAAKAFSVNVGMHGPLLSGEDRALLERDSLRLASHLGTEPRPTGGEWEELLLRSLREGPRSPWAAPAATELLRLAMLSYYPVLPGNRVAGRLAFDEGEAQRVRPAPAVLLDRFAVACCDAKGRFEAEGIPMVEVPTAVRLAVRHPCLRMKREVVVSLPPREVASVFVALPVEHARPCRCEGGDALRDAFDAFCSFSARPAPAVHGPGGRIALSHRIS